MGKKREPSAQGTIPFNQVIDYRTFEKVDDFLEKVKSICLKKHIRHYKGDVVSNIINSSPVLKLTPEEYVEKFCKR